jgi:hypothetical protein
LLWLLHCPGGGGGEERPSSVMVGVMGLLLFEVQWLRSVGWFDVLYVNRMVKEAKRQTQKWELQIFVPVQKVLID